MNLLVFGILLLTAFNIEAKNSGNTTAEKDSYVDVHVTEPLKPNSTTPIPNPTILTSTASIAPVNNVTTTTTTNTTTIPSTTTPSTNTTTSEPHTPSTTPANFTTEKPLTTVNPPSSSPSSTVTVPVPNTSSSPVEPVPAKVRHFDGLSFMGGIILTACLVGLSVGSYKFYKIKTEQSYLTL